MRKSIIIILCFLCVICVITITYADDIEVEEESENAWIYDEFEAANAKEESKPVLNSRSAVIYDRNSGEIIWGKDENSQRKMASTTKIMTAIIVIENVQNMEDIVTVSSKAAGIGGSRLRFT